MKSFVMTLAQAVVRFWRSEVEARQDVVFVDPGEALYLPVTRERVADEETEPPGVVWRAGHAIRRIIQANTLDNSTLLIQNGYWPSPLDPVQFYFCSQPATVQDCNCLCQPLPVQFTFRPYSEVLALTEMPVEDQEEQVARTLLPRRRSPTHSQLRLAGEIPATARGTDLV